MITNLTLARIATARPRPTPRPEPLPFNMPIQRDELNRGNTQDPNERHEQKCTAYLDSCLQALEHRSIFQHIRNDHKSDMKIIYIKVQ